MRIYVQSGRQNRIHASLKRPTWHLENLNIYREFILCFLGLALPAQMALANGPIVPNGLIQTDGTVGTTGYLHVPQTLSTANNGATVTITQAMGSAAGANLFHSFSEFNVNTYQTVKFTENVSNTFDNVISRVTGNNPSVIDGMLKSTMGHAAFYFINPNGVTFMENAAVDVPGAFHVSTADKIDFRNNGGSFYADVNQQSTLSNELPAALGFLATNSANNGLIDVQGSWFGVKAGQTLDLVAGNITIENTPNWGAWLAAPGGEIRLVAMQGAGTVDLLRTTENIFPLPTQTPSAINGGAISVNNSRIDSNGAGGGRIAAWADDISLYGSVIYTVNNSAADAGSANGMELRSNSMLVDYTYIWSVANGSGRAGDIFLSAGNLSIQNGGQIYTKTYSSGRGGNIQVSADALTINTLANPLDTGIFSYTNSSGNAGNLLISAKTLDILNGGVVSSSSYASGNAGSVNFTADSMKIDGQGFTPGMTGIFSYTGYSGSGLAGDLIIRAGTLEILRGGQILSSTAAQANAGNISVTVGNSLNIDGYQTGIFTNTGYSGNGKAGDLTIHAGNLDILKGGQISSTSYDQGNAGNISVTVNEALTINSLGFNTYITGVFSNTFGSGQGGMVSIIADALNIFNSGKISSSTFSDGNAGSIDVNARAVTIDGQNHSYGYTGLLSQAGLFSSGNAGNVTLTAGTLEIANGGVISTSTAATGNAGSVSIIADTLKIDGQGYSSAPTGIFSEATESGSNAKAGNVTVQAGGLDILEGGVVSSTTYTNGDGGKVDVTASTLTIDGKSHPSLSTGIFALASGWNSTDSGNAGTITVRAGSLDILNGGFISSSTYDQGSAGDIRVIADTLAISNSGGISADTYFGGAGSEVELNVLHLNMNSGGAISTTTYGTANAGNIVIRGMNGGQTRAADITIDGVNDNISFNLPKNGVPDAGEQVVGASSGIFLNSNGSGNGGSLDLQADRLTISDGGVISAIATRGQDGATPQGGNIDIHTGSLNLTGGGLISTSTSGAGNAGIVDVAADESISISGHYDRNLHPAYTNYRISELSGISSNATYALDPGAANLGAGGSVIVSTPSLTLADDGEITVSTAGAKGAGNIDVHIGKLDMIGGGHISAASIGPNSSGITGDVIVTAGDSLRMTNSSISIENQATIANDIARAIHPGNISVTSPDIVLHDSAISSNSSGNVAAGSIAVNFVRSLYMDPSYITTTANTGDGGAININGGGLLTLQNSGIRTSVSGADGNGGNIFVSADILNMFNGLIQANAIGGNGGGITLNLGALIADNNTLIMGGRAVSWQPFIVGLNIIQAASETGVSGTLNVTAPQLNLSGVLANIGGPQFDASFISQDYCELGIGSTLTSMGPGGLPPKSSDLYLY